MQADKDDYKLIYHKKKNKGEYVIIEKNDFHELLEMLIHHNIIKV